MNASQRRALKLPATALTAAAALIVSLATSAHAQDPSPDPRREMLVNYGDLDLDSERGARVLLARLRQAAQVTCKPLEGRSLADKSNLQICYDRALGSAVARINKPSVSALYQASLASKNAG